MNKKEIKGKNKISLNNLNTGRQNKNLNKSKNKNQIKTNKSLTKINNNRTCYIYNKYIFFKLPAVINRETNFYIIEVGTLDHNNIFKACYLLIFINIICTKDLIYFINNFEDLVKEFQNKNNNDLLDLKDKNGEPIGYICNLITENGKNKNRLNVINDTNLNNLNNNNNISNNNINNSLKNNLITNININASFLINNNNQIINNNIPSINNNNN